MTLYFHKVERFLLCVEQAFIHSFIHSGYFYRASSSPLLLRGAPDTAWVLCWSFTPKSHRHLRVKDLCKVLTLRLERDSNLRPFERKVPNLPMSHQSPQLALQLLPRIK